VIGLELNGARVAFSTRQGGVSQAPYDSLNLGILTDDEQTRVTENRRRLAGALQLDPKRIAMGWQVHGTDLKEWGAPPDRGGYAHAGAQLPKVDGHATGERHLALLVLAADCLPVALASKDRVAMLHCGWRGLAGGILERAVETFPEPPAAALGPCIEQCCYEVGREVLEAFADIPKAADGRMLSLRTVARTKLEGAGVTQIKNVGLCTSCREDLFFSHRRDDGVTGRQAGMIWRT
jgi:purine-nucleoside/S-methyl-5'-thioadenosine phosphorylase / adenosine deaminase